MFLAGVLLLLRFVFLKIFDYRIGIGHGPAFVLLVVRSHCGVFGAPLINGNFLPGVF